MLSGKKRIKLRQAVQQLQDVLEEHRNDLDTEFLLALRFHTTIARALLGEGPLPAAYMGSIEEAYALLKQRADGDLVGYAGNEVLCGSTQSVSQRVFARRLDWIEQNIDVLPVGELKARLAELDDASVKDTTLLSRLALLREVAAMEST